MKNSKFVKDWLRRAKSNMERAKAGKISEEILYEDLCFDCQQAVEKALKALLISIDKEFPPTHAITSLLELIQETGIGIPEAVKQAIDLTEYVVETRYPGDYEPVNKSDYQTALKTANEVLRWVEIKLEEQG